VRNGLAGRLDSGPGLVEFGDHCVKGAGHVGSGVAVRNRINVQTINAGGMGLHRISESNHRTAKPIGIKMFG
jgi:hypothetical protein